MEYLQYPVRTLIPNSSEIRFKPYYKWNTFNTEKEVLDSQ